MMIRKFQKSGFRRGLIDPESEWNVIALSYFVTTDGALQSYTYEAPRISSCSQGIWVTILACIESFASGM